MGTMKKMLNVLELIKADPGMKFTTICIEAGQLPAEVHDWLEMLRLDGMVEPRHANDGDGVEGWYVLPKGDRAIEWMYEDNPTEEV